MNEKKPSLSPALMEQYRRQMLEMYQTAIPSEENWLDNRFPEPDFQRDRENLPSTVAVQATPTPTPSDQEPTPPDPEPAPPEESAFVGYLRVFVFTAEEAEPIPDARVTVSRDSSLYANVATDRDGFTPVLALPSVDPALTLVPGNPTPYVAYSVTVTADGYEGAQHDNMPVYGNNYVTLPVPLKPLLPGEDPDTLQGTQSGGPANL